MKLTDAQIAMIQEQIDGGINPLIAIVNVLVMLEPKPRADVVFDCVAHKEPK